MSYLTQPSCLCSLHTTNHINIQPSLFLPQTRKIPSSKSPISALDNSNNESLPEPSSSNVSDNSPPDRIKLALEKARLYKKSLHIQPSVDDPPAKTATGDDNGTSLQAAQTLSEDRDGGKEEVLEAARIDVKNAREYEKEMGVLSNDRSKAEQDQLPGIDEKEFPEAARFAIGKALGYKKSQGIVDNSNSSVENAELTGSASNSGNGSIERNSTRKEDLKVSSIDFVGLNFADKKSGRGLPAGLVPVSDPFPESDFPEVEILVGDASKFGKTAPPETKDNSGEVSSDLYKPKVTTWGMFPRPSNISKTFGGGRTIHPGEALETVEDRAAKEAHTRKLISAYTRKTGLNIDPKLKAECEKALIDGDSLMDRGRLKEALPYYQKIMDNLSFKTELHGLAALQWSICEDSLCRPENARGMYEKLQSHPNAQVSKKAKQFMFSFQAMEMMKVTRSSASRRNVGYQKYFEAFVDDKPSYSQAENTEVKDDPLTQALPYIVFLVPPILLVLLLAARKGI